MIITSQGKSIVQISLRFSRLYIQVLELTLSVLHPWQECSTFSAYQVFYTVFNSIWHPLLQGDQWWCGVKAYPMLLHMTSAARTPDNLISGLPQPLGHALHVHYMSWVIQTDQWQNNQNRREQKRTEKYTYIDPPSSLVLSVTTVAPTQ